jgi:hypothetical protein
MITGRWAFAGQVNSSLGELDDRVPFAHSGPQTPRLRRAAMRHWGLTARRGRAKPATVPPMRSYDRYTLGLSVSAGLKPIESCRRHPHRWMDAAAGEKTETAESPIKKTASRGPNDGVHLTKLRNEAILDASGNWRAWLLDLNTRGVPPSLAQLHFKFVQVYRYRVVRRASNVCTICRHRAVSYRPRRSNTPLSRLARRRKQHVKSREWATGLSEDASIESD